MNRREFMRRVALTGAAVGLGGLGTSCGGGSGEGEPRAAPRPLERLMTGESPERPPNIVYIFSDEHRSCSYGAGGNPDVLTPRLDQMAAEGVVFTNCISNYPLCSPHRASLLSGLYPQSHGVQRNLGRGMPMMAPELPTLATVLRREGYACGYVGKWHLQATNQESPGMYVPPGLYRYGFDDYWRATYKNEDRYNTFTFDDSGQVLPLTGYGPEAQTDLALEFIESQVKRPFLLMLSWQPPHPPYGEAPEEFQNLYAGRSVDFRENVPAEHRTPKLAEDLIGYYSHISALDRETGRLLDRLGDLGIADNTIVVYSSDHGDLLRSNGGLGKNRPWEESINVPFVIRWPQAIDGGRSFQGLFSTVDIAPTLLGLVGTGVPVTMEGRDISAGNEIDSVFIMGQIPDLDQLWRGVRTHCYTYAVRGVPGNFVPWLAHDNWRDPFQQVNLVQDRTQRDTIADIEAILDQWLAFAGEA